MKFDADLARQILIDLEEAPPVPRYFDIVLEGHSPEEVSYHIKMLAMDSLVEARDDSKSDRLQWRVRSLTPQGHRFLGEIRDDTQWEQTKAAVVGTAGAFSLAVLKAYIVQNVKEKTGIDINW